MSDEPPFFLFGLEMRRHKEALNRPIRPKAFALAAAVLLAVDIYTGIKNGIPLIYTNEIGKRPQYFYLGAFAGIALIYLISRRLPGGRKHLQTLSSGTIVILGLHYFFIDFCMAFLPDRVFWKYLWSILIMLLFIPIIGLVNRYIPWLNGGRK